MFRSTQAFVGLGGNLGDRHACLQAALDHLDAVPGVSVERVSPWYETAPVGGPPGQPPYLNAVAEIRTDLEPLPLLRVLLSAEVAACMLPDQESGRRRQTTMSRAPSNDLTAAPGRNGNSPFTVAL